VRNNPTRKMTTPSGVARFFKETDMPAGSIHVEPAQFENVFDIRANPANFAGRGGPRTTCPAGSKVKNVGAVVALGSKNKATGHALAWHDPHRPARGGWAFVARGRQTAIA
jgi:hypothetical protein